MNEKMSSQLSTTAKQRLAVSRQALASASQKTVLSTLSQWASLQILELLQKKGASAAPAPSDKR
jgi:hypothetical protein